MKTKTRTVVALGAALILLATILPSQAHHRPNHGGGDTGSGDYELPVWFNWDQRDLDVIVIPPNHGQLFNGNGVLNGFDPNELTPYENSYMAAILDSIQAWKDGIAKHNPNLWSTLSIDVYVLGQDSIPTSVLLDPEVVVTALEETNAYLGVAALGFFVPDCLVSNTKMFIVSFSYGDMYNINAQEFGHCLGLDHVKDNKPWYDPMAGLYEQSIGLANTRIYCISNLDVMALDAVFNGGNGASIAPASYGC